MGMTRLLSTVGAVTVSDPSDVSDFSTGLQLVKAWRAQFHSPRGEVLGDTRI